MSPSTLSRAETLHALLGTPLQDAGEGRRTCRVLPFI